MTKSLKGLLPYENKWVALTPNGRKIIAHANDANALSKKLETLKIKKNEAVMTWVYPFTHSFTPLNV